MSGKPADLRHGLQLSSGREMFSLGSYTASVRCGLRGGGFYANSNTG